VSKTLIDIDDDLLDRVRRELGTTSKRATVNEALRLVDRHTRQAKSLRDLADNDRLGDLNDPEVKKRARR